MRTCETSVYGGLGKGWRTDEGAVVVGPIALLYPGRYAEAPERWFTGDGTRYPAQKVLAVVEQGAVVTVAIAPSAAGAASLLYDPVAFTARNAYKVSGGARAIVFEACAKGEASIGPSKSETQFNGGFIVAGPRCVPIEVWVGRSAAPETRVISFGAGNCA